MLERLTTHRQPTRLEPANATRGTCTLALIPALPFLSDFARSLVQYRPDLTVGYVKVELAKAHDIPFDCQELEVDGKPLADPFSLSDYPQLRASRASNPVRVVVKRVVPSDGEGDEVADAEEAPAADAHESDYDDETFEEE